MIDTNTMLNLITDCSDRINELNNEISKYDGDDDNYSNQISLLMMEISYYEFMINRLQSYL